jgi:hypothetical protein
MTSFITVVYAILFFLVIILDNPFKGFFSLSDEPFRIILNEIDPKGCNSENCPKLLLSEKISLRNKSFLNYSKV